MRFRMHGCGPRGFDIPAGLFAMGFGPRGAAAGVAAGAAGTPTGAGMAGPPRPAPQFEPAAAAGASEADRRTSRATATTHPRIEE